MERATDRRLNVHGSSSKRRAPRRAQPRVERGAPATGAGWNAALAAVFLVALAWRLLCLRRYLASPLFGDLPADSEIYWKWAQVLTRDGWLGHNPFFLAPLYPYLLALFRPTATSSWLAPLVVQCVCGSLAAVLIASSARRLCDPRSALVVGLLAAGSAMGTFMDLSLLSESLLWLMGAAFIRLQLVAHDRPRPRMVSSLSGLLIGLMTLGRPSFGLLLAPHLVAASARRGWRAGWRSTGLAAAVAGLVCLPVLVRHLVLGYGWIPVTYSLGYNAYVGNGPGATGAYVSRIDDLSPGTEAEADIEGGVSGDGRWLIRRTEGVSLSPQESSRYWLRKTSAHVAATPGAAARLLVRKVGLSLNHVESTQLDDIYVHERVEGPLGLPGAGAFGVVGALGLFGLFAIRKRIEGRVLLAHALVVLAPLVLFFVTDRYRHHLTLPLLVACGPALEALLRAIRGLRSAPARGLATLAPLVPALASVSIPLVPFHREQTEFRSHYALGKAALRREDLAAAEAELQKCVEPSLLERLPIRQSAAARAAVARTLHMLGDIHAERGSYARGEQCLRAALGYDPGMRDLVHDHAVLLALIGRHEAALSESNGSGIPRDELTGDLMRIARSAVAGGVLGPAEQALRATIALDSTEEAANIVLLRLLFSQHRELEGDRLLALLPGRRLSPRVIQRERVTLMSAAERPRGAVQADSASALASRGP